MHTMRLGSIEVKPGGCEKIGKGFRELVKYYLAEFFSVNDFLLERVGGYPLTKKIRKVVFDGLPNGSSKNGPSENGSSKNKRSENGSSENGVSEIFSQKICANFCGLQKFPQNFAQFFLLFFAVRKFFPKILH